MWEPVTEGELRSHNILTFDYTTCETRGHTLINDYIQKNEAGEPKRVYLDNGKPYDQMRPCAFCGQPPTKDGHDACLGGLPGVKNACCGHGRHRGYVNFVNGVIVNLERKHY